MSAVAGLSAAAAAATLILTVGCAQPGVGGSDLASPHSVSSASCARPSGSAWATYSDAVVGFSVRYPPGFTFELQRDQAGGVEVSYRAVETCYLKMFPPGQLEVTVYQRDADSLIAWVDKHTGSPAFTSGTDQYFSGVTHEVPVRVASRDALAFNWQPDAAPYTVHNTALFLGTAYVLVLGWWAEDALGLPSPAARAAYAADLQADYEMMLANLSFS